MQKIKSMSPGVLIISDANLRLMAGEIAEVERVTRQMESAINLGLLKRVETEASAESDLEDLSKLSAADAIAKVNAETDPDKLRRYQLTEKRRSVLDVMRNRQIEVSNAAK